MKIFHLLPVFAHAQGDDTSTLLSLKVHTSLEVGVDHLLDAVGSRNVTQMSSLLQNLVEESISDGLGELDGDVKTALALIKQELLGDIRNSLKEAHCFSQVNLHEKILCFEKCELDRAAGKKSCGHACDGSEHKMCRETLFGYYKDHIIKCRDLDHFVHTAISPCPHYEKGCCYLPHTTWNCEGPCEGTISGLHVNDEIGDWIKKQIYLFKQTHEQWEKLYKMCKHSYRVYIEKDAECDCKQAECETRNCEHDSCLFMNCEHNYQACWGGCEAAVCAEYPKEDCLEKDRKIDWAATEKIECYVDVLMANPTKKDLLAKCGTEDCINKWREEMYLDCSKICPEVDYGDDDYSHGPVFPPWKGSSGECRTPGSESCAGKFSGSDNECIDIITEVIAGFGQHKRRQGDQDFSLKPNQNHADEDVTAEGQHSVTTNHRSHHSADERRCTAHLDLDWQAPPCCMPCEERPSKPCEGEDYSKDFSKTSYIWLHYGKWGFLDEAEIDGFDYDKCYASAGEHTYVYAYNLCKCIDCPRCPTPHCPTCTEKKSCSGCGKEHGYDYSVHYPARKAKCEDRDDGFRHPAFGVARAIANGELDKDEAKALIGKAGIEEEH